MNAIERLRTETPVQLYVGADILALRAWARARLWQIGELTLQEAVDVMQAYAEETSLVEEIGQDRVQTLIAEQFQAVRE
jgi:hypothetical protein